MLPYTYAAINMLYYTVCYKTIYIERQTLVPTLDIILVTHKAIHKILH